MELPQQLAAVGFVLSLLVWGASAARRGGWITASWRLPSLTRQAQRSLEPLERIQLTAQHSLHLVRVQGRVVLFATHPGGTELLPVTDQMQSRTAGAGQ